MRILSMMVQPISKCCGSKMAKLSPISAPTVLNAAGLPPSVREAFNYTVDDEKYSFDLITPDALPTNNIDWQYSPLNSIAVHHALLTSGLEPQDVEIVVTLPLTEFYDEDAQYRLDNIERKKEPAARS